MPRKQAAAKPKAEDDGFGDIGDLLKAAVAETTHFPHYDPGGEAEVRKSEDGKTRTGVVDLNEDACYVSLLKCDRLVFEGKGATSIDSSPMTRIHIDMSNLANKAVLKQLERLTGLQHVYCYGDGTTLKLVEKMPKWIQPKLQRVGVIDLSHDRVDLAGLALEKVVVMGSSSEAPVLRSLCLDGNLLAELPEELGQCGSLHALYAHKNRLTEFPDWISELVGLKALELQMNQIKGALPSSIGDSLTELEYLWLGDNQLTGLVPSSYGKLTKLTDVVLSPNPFEKPLPVPKREETAVSYMQRCVKDHN